MSRRSLPLLALVALAACEPAPAPSTTETLTGPFDHVEVATAGGRVEFTAGEGDDVVLEFLPSTSDQYTALEDGGTLTLTATCFGEDVAGCSGGFLLTVPAGQSLRARTDAGNVDFLPGLFGPLEAQTANGDITFADVGGTEATVVTGTGVVEARFTEPPLGLSFDSGSSPISVAVPAGTYALDLDSTGAVTVGDGIEDGAGATIRLHSGTGAIDLSAAAAE